MISALRRRRWSLAWLIGIVLLGILLAWLASVPLLRGEPDGRAGSRVGERAPELELVDLDGQAWSLADAAAGGRLVWVNFWATSCEPCRTEMPAMQRLAEAYPDELLILGVNWGEERGGVEDFVARYSVTYPVLLDPTLEAFHRWAGTDGLPRHYFIGSEGTILREIVGPLEPGRMVAVLEALLPAPAAIDR
jgi:thiol-disulfide isomerase/thioredoxin